jgi:hypothetical protein
MDITTKCSLTTSLWHPVVVVVVVVQGLDRLVLDGLPVGNAKLAEGAQ